MAPRQNSSFPAPAAAGPSSGSSRAGASKTRRASQAQTSDTRKASTKADGLEVEEFQPPEWRTVLNSRADLGEFDVAKWMMAAPWCGHTAKIGGRSTCMDLTDSLGYPDFYPSRPGFNQPEDVLTEENVKNGFVAKPFVTVGVSSIPLTSY